MKMPTAIGRQNKHENAGRKTSWHACRVRLNVCLAVCCVCLLWIVPTWSLADQGSPVTGLDGQKKVSLFGTVEFRSRLRHEPWQRVIKEEQRKSGMDNPLEQREKFWPNTQEILQKKQTARQTAMWPATRDALKQKKLKMKDLLDHVNSFFNGYPYRRVADIYRLRNYWSTPAEFMANSGDCKDFAIVKYFALKQLGVAPESMRIVVLEDLSQPSYDLRNRIHAVLAVYHADTVYILDNKHAKAVEQEMLKTYEAKFSVNAQYLWTHAKPLRKPSSTKPRPS